MYLAKDAIISERGGRIHFGSGADEERGAVRISSLSKSEFLLS